MLLAHLLAVVVTALVLAHAEDVLWRTLRRLLPAPVRPWTPGHLAPPAHDVASFAVGRAGLTALPTRSSGPAGTASNADPVLPHGIPLPRRRRPTLGALAPPRLTKDNP